MLLAIVIVVMKFQGLLGQVTLSIISEAKIECSSSVKLRCVPASGCCGNTIEWKKAGSLIMSAGNPIIPGKYVQTTGSTYFDLTINSINIDDLNSPYHCVYDTINSNEVTIRSENYYCPNCIACGFYTFVLTLYGALIALCVILILSIYIVKLNRYWTEFDSYTASVTVTVVAWVLAAVFTISFFIGTETCWCIHGDVWYTTKLIGLGIVVVAVVIVYCGKKWCCHCCRGKRTGRDVIIMKTANRSIGDHPSSETG